ncbi:MAG: adenylate/guanylate cyclase domain-containing protein [Terrimonas sp.]|nr:adenylate/guanylate cyclase domain-containing protein [Terrimonas sp.]
MNNCITRKACCFWIGFLFFINAAIGQDQKLADSLALIYQKNNLQDTAKMELLRNLSFNELKDLPLGVQYAEELISLARQKKNELYLFRGYQLLGNKKRLMGDLEEALDAYFKGIDAATNAKYLLGEGTTYMAIADVYSISQNHPNAMLYYNKAIKSLRQANDSSFLAAALTNAGSEYSDNEIYDSALLYFRESTIISEKVDYLIGKAYNLGNMGIVYAEMGQNDLAEKNINEAIGILEDNEVYDPICSYTGMMSDIYLEKGDRKAALGYALRSLHLAEQHGLKDQISDANLKLSELYEKAGMPEKAYEYYKAHITYRDSVNNVKSVQTMANLRTNFEVAKKQTEVDLLTEKRRNQRNLMISLFVILGLSMVILGTLYWYYRTIAREKKRSESLLLNILPATTADELKRNGRVEAVKFQEVTVLFTDFVKFTKVAEQVEPEQLVESIDFYFKGFDEISTRYGLEKIKTVGDSYMCAGGLPVANPAHAKNVIRAAKEMADFVKKELNANDDLSHFEVRIGVHTGPVVAGIVGIKKWQYDIWGDTVNIASRMESKSEPGRVNLSESTWQIIKDEFPCEYRGEIEIKNRGLVKMYFLL